MRVRDRLDSVVTAFNDSFDISSSDAVALIACRLAFGYCGRELKSIPLDEQLEWALRGLQAGTRPLGSFPVPLLLRSLCSGWS